MVKGYATGRYRELQMTALRKHGCKWIYKSDLKRMMKSLHRRDRVVVMSVSSFDVKSLVEFMDEIEKVGCEIEFIREMTVVKCPSSRFSMHVMCAMVNFQLKNGITY